MQRLCSAAVIASMLGACVKTLPASPTPPPVAPPMQAAPPPAPGQGRLLVDVVDGPVRVQRVTMQARQGPNGRFQFFESPQVLCAVTPCATDLPVGNLLLNFPVLGNNDTTETELVYLGNETSVYRRSLSYYDDNGGGLGTVGIVMTSFGGMSMITGAALLPIGLADDRDGMTLAGEITLGVGAALVGFGIWAMLKDRSVYRPGSSNHFPLAPQ